MADTKKIGARIVLDGEQEFNQSLRNSKTALKEFDSELKLSQTQFKNNSKSLEALEKVQQSYIKQQEQLKKQEKAYVDQLSKASEAHTKAKNQHAETAKSVEELRKKLNEAEKEYGQNSDEVQKLNSELEKSEAQYKKEESAIAGLENKMSKWQTGLNDTRTALSNVEKNLEDVNNDIEHFDDEIEDAGNATAKANPEMDKLGVSMGKLVSADLIAEGIKKLAGAVVDLAKASFDVGTEFEASMSQVAATMGITTDEIASGSETFERLNDAAKASGKSTIFSASESASALNFLALAGYDADKAIETLPKVLDLAAAGNMDLAYASDLVTDSMSALGMETDQLDTYIDEMARTAQKSNTSVAQLGEATLVCAGAVSQVNMPLDTMNAALGVLANNGIKGAEGGTHLRNAILSLVAPTDKAQVALKTLGVSVTDSNGNMRDFEDILKDLNNALDGMGNAERANMIKNIFNKTDISAVNALLKSTNGEFSDLKGNILDSAGAASEMAKTMNDNLQGKITILQSALEGLGISFYEIFDEDAKKAVDGATSAIGRLTKSVKSGDLNVSLDRMSDALSNLIDKAVDWAEKNLPKIIDGLTGFINSLDLIIPLVKGVVTGLLAFKTATTAVATANAIMTAYTTITSAAAVATEELTLAQKANPWILAASSILGVVAATASLVGNLSNTRDHLNEVEEATYNLIEATDQANESYMESAKKRQESRESYDIQKETVDGLIDELDKLQTEYHNGADNMTEMQMVIDQLNEAMPELNVYFDEETNSLNMSTEAIRANAAALLQRYKVEAAEQDLKDIAKDRYEAEKNLIQLRKQKVEADKNLEQAEKDLQAAEADTTSTFETNGQSLEAAQKAYYNAANAAKDVNDQITEQEAVLASCDEEYQVAVGYINENTEALEKEEEALNAVNEKAGETAGQAKIMSDEFQEATEKMRESIQSTLEASNDIFNKTTETTKQNIGDMKKNVQDHVDQITKWGDSYSELASRVDDKSGKVLEYIANMGVEGQGYIDELLTLDDEELNKFVNQMEEALTLPETISQDIRDSYTTAVQESVDGMRDIVSNAAADGSELRVAEEELADTLQDTLKEKWGDDGKKIKEETDKVMKAIQDAIADSEDGAELTTEELCNIINAVIQNGMDYETYKKYGGYVGDGIADGIASKEAKVKDAVNKLTNAAKNTTTGDLKIQSPSKVFKQYGEYVGEGFQIGIEESMGGIVDTINNMMPNDSNVELSSFQNISMNANDAGNGILARIDKALTQYLPVLSQMQIVLDTGATVGALAPGMNSELGKIATRGSYR